MAVALASATMRIEVFTFSTRLQRVTVEVRRAAAGATSSRSPGSRRAGGHDRRVPPRFPAQGRRAPLGATVVIIASDEFDVGMPEGLEPRHESCTVVGRRGPLNPLLETERGTNRRRAARGAAAVDVTMFKSVNDAFGSPRRSVSGPASGRGSRAVLAERGVAWGWALDQPFDRRVDGGELGDADDDDGTMFDFMVSTGSDAGTVESRCSAWWHARARCRAARGCRLLVAVNVRLPGASVYVEGFVYVLLLNIGGARGWMVARETGIGVGPPGASHIRAKRSWNRSDRAQSSPWPTSTARAAGWPAT